MEKFNLLSCVLLIEDDFSHAQLISRALKGICTEVVHCENFAKGLKALKDRVPDIILSDLHLPDASSAQEIMRIKEDREDIPIIVLTSSTSLQDAVEAMKAGAKDFIVKNFDAHFSEVLQLSIQRVSRELTREKEKLSLQREMEALRLAIENSSDGMAVANQDGKVLYKNSSYLSFARRCSGGEDNIYQLLSPSVKEWDKVSKSLRERLSSLSIGEVWKTEVAFAHDPQSAYEFSLSAISLPDIVEKHSENAHYVLHIRNVSEQKRREKFQRELLSTTTHDLKGPLGAIMISADLLESYVGENKKAKELVVRVGSSAQGALNLIDEFLSARRIQEGTLILRPDLCNTREAVEGIADSFQAMASAKRIQLILEIDEKVLEWKVDKLGLERVISNLLSNALKFTSTGGVVKLELAQTENELHLKVQDNGCGMEPSEVHSIFECFSRLEKHRGIAGSGIGLFVVKSIVTAHGGKIEVTSKVGKGTTFDIVFPRDLPVNERGELICLDFVK